MKNSYYHIGGIFFGLMFAAVSTSIKAQIRTISGTVTSSGKPLQGVVISQEGSDQVTMTGANGTYRLEVSAENPILLFRHPDYAEEKFKLTHQTVVNISLEQKVKGIEEVIINAGYYKVRDKERTGSIASVSAKDIENQPVTNALSAMQGRMAGVSIVQNSGTAGGGFDVQIRGRNSLRTYSTSSFNANAPLYIIDGIPMPSGNEFRSGLASAVLPYSDTNPLNAINPDDIQSIEVLKDADATAIYGSRGANGVILITTKQGVKGKTQFSFSSSYGLGRIARLPKMMSTEDYIKMRKAAFANDGIQTIPITAYDLKTWDQNKYTDWQDYFIGNWCEQTGNHINVSGGNENTKFTLSGAHDEQTTVFPGNYRYKRNNAGLSVQHQSTDRRFSVNFSSYYTTQSNVLPPTDFYRIYTGIAPNAPDLYTPDGSINWENNTFTNPMAAASQTYKTDSKQLISNLTLEYKIVSGLTAKLNSGYTENTINEKRLYPKTFYNPSTNIGSERSAIRKGETNSTSWIVEPQLSYTKQIGKHSFNLLVGTTFQEQQATNQVLYASNFPSDELIENIGSAQSVVVSSTGSFVYHYQSVYGRFNYQLDKKYILNITARRDGSSRFGPANRYSNFGALGAAWIISNEKFLESLPWISFAKLRGSYGTAGSDLIGDYQYLDTYQSGLYPYDGVPSVNPVRLFNPNFGWERTKKFETALELSFFKNRINFTGAYYRNRSSSQLVGIPLPGTTGFTSIQANLDATVQNSGWEFTLESTHMKKDDWSWNTSLNLSAPRNKLIDFPNIQGSTYANTLAIGHSTVIRKLFHYTGIDPTTGVYQFEDVNKDGKLDINDRTVIKDIGVRWEAGITNNIQYKSWKLQFLIQLVNQLQNNSYSYAANLGLMGNLPIQFLDYWTPENPNATFQKPTTYANTTLANAALNFNNSDATVSNALYVRLRNISLQYDFPKETFKSMHMSVFFQGQNLWTWTKFKNLDPEFITAGFTPPLQVFSLGFNIKF
ncbi:SusC/RagA family TonB-linked outer membrane protein [Chryseobacterium taiwanense]|uniref:TonB-dependent receptor n=1 Tax=Chryseobacterium taiwanense TaxID=363331 RepID=A0A0B4E411_9FLAO|nr:SusC/RagA family TonB-linked outer membrane protein [Chryseobacterium taiwanense]KIC61343.1 TonB-dependent receptor [Chryseobacterium taiwanense]